MKSRVIFVLMLLTLAVMGQLWSPGTGGSSSGGGGGGQNQSPLLSVIDGSDYGFTNLGMVDIDSSALPTSLLFGGGNATRWNTNLSAHVLIVPTNLVANRRYEVTIVSAGYSAIVSNSAAIRWTDRQFDGQVSTNGTTVLTVWKDLITGFTNGIVEGPQFTIAPGSFTAFATNFLSRTITISSQATNSGVSSILNTLSYNTTVAYGANVTNAALDVKAYSATGGTNTIIAAVLTLTNSTTFLGLVNQPSNNIPGFATNTVTGTLYVINPAPGGKVLNINPALFKFQGFPSGYYPGVDTNADSVTVFSFIQDPWGTNMYMWGGSPSFNATTNRY